jgi:hypothetical protein
MLMFKLYFLTSVADVVASVTLNYQLIRNSLEFEIVIFVLSAQNDCFLLGHENEFVVETVRSRLQTHTNVRTKQSSCARNTNTIFSTTAFENFCFFNFCKIFLGC